MILELVVRVELAVGDDQRNFVGPGRKRRRIRRIIENEQAGQAHPDIHAGLIHAVLVIPLHRPALVFAILDPVDTYRCGIDRVRMRKLLPEGWPSSAEAAWPP